MGTALTVSTPSIYVIDDDENIRLIIKRFLEKEGYRVIAFDSAVPALKTFEKDKPDMVILDIMMPGIDGYEMCRRLRSISQVPIIMVSAKDDEVDKIVGLELGSDDYLSKPFSPRELVARVKTVFRRTMNDVSSYILCDTEPLLQVGDLTISPAERTAYCNGQRIDLTTKEFELLWILLSRLNRPYTRSQLLVSVWGHDYYGDDRAVDDLIKRLRKKLRDFGTQVQIKTVYGYGYKAENL